MNKLAALFEGKTPKSKVAFNALLERLPEEPNIAWYPSAGLDFKDLIEVNRTSIIPDLHIHTDYSTSALLVNIIFNLKIMILKKYNRKEEIESVIRVSVANFS
ncbi:DUF7663 domain-containing protein [Tenacibaculum finnmarkense]|uniref:DUF7663 domain-containing protein n=1 Tax=Tenacibaculum finnmarkense TaxID=2781243 RepID=UPI003F7A914B